MYRPSEGRLSLLPDIVRELKACTSCFQNNLQPLISCFESRWLPFARLVFISYFSFWNFLDFQFHNCWQLEGILWGNKVAVLHLQNDPGSPLCGVIQVTRMAKLPFLQLCQVWQLAPYLCSLDPATVIHTTVTSRTDFWGYPWSWSGNYSSYKMQWRRCLLASLWEHI